MTREGMIAALRAQLADEQSVAWPADAELLDHLDLGADYLSEQLIAAKDPTLRKRMTLDGQGWDRLCSGIGVTSRDDDPLSATGEETDLPDDFIAFVGAVPVDVVGRRCISYNRTKLTLDYWASLPKPSAFEAEDELPYTREQALLIVDLGRVLAMNRNEFDTSQDLGLLGTLNGAIAKTRGSR